MRHFFWTGVVLAASLAASGAQMRAQAGAPGDAAVAAGQAPAPGPNGGMAGANSGARGVQGTVTAVAADKVTIQTVSGETYTVTVTANTRVMKDRQPIKAGDVKVGDGATAIGAVDGPARTVQATMLMDVDAETVKKAREDMGKTYITGRITAIDADNLKLTVLRTDNVIQVIQVDEGTSFQKGTRGIAVPSVFAMGMGGMGGGRGMRGGGQGGGSGGGAPAAGPPVESITLADVKLGDSIAATGALKGGVFVPVKMGVAEPGAGRRQGASADRRTAPPAAPAAPEAASPQ